MNRILIAAGLAGAIAALVTSLVVPAVERLARTLRAFDHPGGRRQHVSVVPRLGGVAIAAGIGLGAGIMALVHWTEWGRAIPKVELATFAGATSLIFLVGVVDDILGVSMAKKFLVQFLAASLLVYVGWSFSSLKLPVLGLVELGVFGPALSVVWIVGVTNAINLLDGLDGLASGVTAIIASGVLVLALFQENLMTVLLMAAVAGACLGFLRHNWEPARIFMGDSGALTLGFLLGTMSLHASLKSSSAVAILVPILALGLPVIDTLMVMVVRFLNAPKGPAVRRLLRMFRADRQHLHHILERLGPSRRRIVTGIYAVAVVFCAMAVLVAVRNQMALGFTLLTAQIVFVLAMRWLGLRRAAKELAAAKRAALREELGGEQTQEQPAGFRIEPRSDSSAP